VLALRRSAVEFAVRLVEIPMQASPLFIGHTLAPLLAALGTRPSLTLGALAPLIAGGLPALLSLGQQKGVGRIGRPPGSRACHPDRKQQCVYRVFHAMNTTLITPAGIVRPIIVPIAALAIAALLKHNT
jgi:hypothetical protein